MYNKIFAEYNELPKRKADAKVGVAANTPRVEARML